MNDLAAIYEHISGFKKRHKLLPHQVVLDAASGRYFLGFLDSLGVKYLDDNTLLYSTIPVMGGAYNIIPLLGDRTCTFHVGKKKYSLAFTAAPGHACRGYSQVVFVATTMPKEDFLARLAEFIDMQENEIDRIHLLGEGDSQARPTNTWDELVLPGDKLELIRSTTDNFFKEETRDMYARTGLAYKRGILFVGPPGTGKTLAARIILANPKVRGYILPLKAKLEDDTVRQAFSTTAKGARPAVLVLEDLDRFSQSMASLGYLLNQMDGIRSNSGLLVIATANNPENIDRALLQRPSRFDTLVNFSLPDTKMRELYLTRINKNSGSLFSAETIAQVVEQSKGFSIAYLQEVITGTMLLGIHRKCAPTDSLLMENLGLVRKQMRYAAKYAALDTETEQKSGIGFSSSHCGGACGN